MSDLVLSGAGANALAEQTRNTALARQLIADITNVGQKLEDAFRLQTGQIAALGYVLRSEKAARPGTFQEWARTTMHGTNERDLRRYMALSQAIDIHNAQTSDRMKSLLLGGEMNATYLIEVGTEVTAASGADTQRGLWNWAAKESHPKPAPRVRNAKPLTPKEAEQRRLEEIGKDWVSLESQLAGFGASFCLQDDFVVGAQIAALERQLKARHAWLKVPKAKRNAQLVAAIEQQLKPALTKALKK